MKDSPIMKSMVMLHMQQQSLIIKPEVVGSILGGCKIRQGVQKVKENPTTVYDCKILNNSLVVY